MTLDEHKQRAIVRGYSEALNCILSIYRNTLTEIEDMEEMRDIAERGYEIELIRQIIHLNKWGKEEREESRNDLRKLERDVKRSQNEIEKEKDTLKEDVRILKSVARKYCLEREKLYDLMEGLEDNDREIGEEFIKKEVARRIREMPYVQTYNKL